MRFFALHSRNAPVESEQGPGSPAYHPSGAQPPDDFVRASGAFVVRGVPPPQPEQSWNFTTMAAQAQFQEDLSIDLERSLAEDIARAMQHRPLMSRLARIEATYADEVPGVLPARITETTRPPPIPVNDTPPPLPAMNGSAAMPIDQLMEEFGADEPTLPSPAEWLGKARREHAHARLRNIAGWFATLTIGGSLIALATLIIKT
jgi:hypothetical protein